MATEMLNVPGELEALRKLRKNIVSQQKLLPIDDEIGRSVIRGKLESLAEEEHFLQSAQASGEVTRERYLSSLADSLIRNKEKLIQLKQQKIDHINSKTRKTYARTDAIRAEIVATYRLRRQGQNCRTGTARKRDGRRIRAAVCRRTFGRRRDSPTACVFPRRPKSKTEKIRMTTATKDKPASITDRIVAQKKADLTAGRDYVAILAGGEVPSEKKLDAVAQAADRRGWSELQLSGFVDVLLDEHGMERNSWPAAAR